jgi:xanthine dehydrogenase accessory factor
MAEIVSEIRLGSVAAASAVPPASAAPPVSAVSESAVRLLPLTDISEMSGESDPIARTAIDPVCGMTVVIGDGTPHAVVDGVEHWFCCAGCRDRFAAA